MPHFTFKKMSIVVFTNLYIFSPCKMSLIVRKLLKIWKVTFQT